MIGAAVDSAPGSGRRARVLQDPEAQVAERATVTEGSVPRIAPGGRLHFDKQRDQWVILAPERLFVLDAIAHEVVKRCDGAATVAEIVDDLAATYAADRGVILSDVSSLLQGLADKRIVAL